MTCDYSHLDGAYVLGALSPSERQEFEEHLSGCLTCARAVRELAGLPGLLARADASTLEETAAAEDPPGDVPEGVSGDAPGDVPGDVPRDVPGDVPETLLPSLLREVRRTQRRRTALTAGLAAAAAVVVVGGTAVVTDTLGRGTEPSAAPPSTSASLSPSTGSSTGPGRDMIPVVAGPVSAQVSLAGVDWGTRLDLTCTYATAGGAPATSYPADSPPTYALVVHTRDGRAEQVATWRAVPGRTMHLSAATDAGPGQIESVEVQSAQGQPLLRLRV